MSRPWRKKKRHAPVRVTPWLFLIQPEMLPGAFRVQPLRPDPRLLPNVILEGMCKAVHSAKELIEKQRQAGAEIAGTKAMATTVEHMLNLTFAGIVPVEVITIDEMYDRAERGDFDLHVLEDRHIQLTNHRLAKLQGVKNHGHQETQAQDPARL